MRIELRQILKPEVAAFAAQRATKADLERLEDALHGMSQSLRDPELFYGWKVVMLFIDIWERHWRRHQWVFSSIRNKKPAPGRKAVLDDLSYAEGLLRAHIRESRKSSPLSRAPKRLVPFSNELKPGSPLTEDGLDAIQF
jgi:hypothetical protein